MEEAEELLRKALDHAGYLDSDAAELVESIAGAYRKMMTLDPDVEFRRPWAVAFVEHADARGFSAEEITAAVQSVLCFEDMGPVVVDAFQNRLGEILDEDPLMTVAWSMVFAAHLATQYQGVGSALTFAARAVQMAYERRGDA